MILGYIVGKTKNRKQARLRLLHQLRIRRSQYRKRSVYDLRKTAFKAYEENEVATDENMKGKLISVNGVVQSIDKDFTDSIIIGLQTDNQFMPARMEMENSEKATAVALKKDSRSL